MILFFVGLCVFPLSRFRDLLELLPVSFPFRPPAGAVSRAAPVRSSLRAKKKDFRRFAGEAAEVPPARPCA